MHSHCAKESKQFDRPLSKFFFAVTSSNIQQSQQSNNITQVCQRPLNKKDKHIQTYLLVLKTSIDMQKLPGSFGCYSNLSPRVIQPIFYAQSLCILHSDCAITSTYVNRWSLDVSLAGESCISSLAQGNWKCPNSLIILNQSTTIQFKIQDKGVSPRHLERFMSSSQMLQNRLKRLPLPPPLALPQLIPAPSVFSACHQHSPSPNLAYTPCLLFPYKLCIDPSSLYPYILLLSGMSCECNYPVSLNTSSAMCFCQGLTYQALPGRLENVRILSQGFGCGKENLEGPRLKPRRSRGLRRIRLKLDEYITKAKLWVNGCLRPLVQWMKMRMLNWYSLGLRKKSGTTGEKYGILAQVQRGRNWAVSITQTNEKNLAFLLRSRCQAQVICVKCELQRRGLPVMGKSLLRRLRCAEGRFAAAAGPPIEGHVLNTVSAADSWGSGHVGGITRGAEDLRHVGQRGYERRPVHPHPRTSCKIERCRSSGPSKERTAASRPRGSRDSVKGIGQQLHGWCSGNSITLIIFKGDDRVGGSCSVWRGGGTGCYHCQTRNGNIEK
ncbi:hypothetical protein VP01_3489g2 [Puccinia sorghi]|uniref:Uncharacterized protein n=1 Tax=Puccinia sorghi TaxID=27349 RepID=A0A0L6UVV9_9BASI|nr:hypothetical protein VP01_3489g2 [Puccinia sorghi]